MGDSEWRKTILERLLERNKRENSFQDLIQNSE